MLIAVLKTSCRFSCWLPYQLLIWKKNPIRQPATSFRLQIQLPIRNKVCTVAECLKLYLTPGADSVAKSKRKSDYFPVADSVADSKKNLNWQLVAGCRFNADPEANLHCSRMIIAILTPAADAVLQVIRRLRAGYQYPQL